jgi:hypothetical protein
MADIGQVDGRIGKAAWIRKAKLFHHIHANRSYPTFGVRDSTGTSLKLVTKLQRDEISTLNQFRAVRFV